MPAYQYIYVMKGLSKTYPGGREVLKDIWLSFLPGAKIGVLGANGAGKSTLLRIMAGDEGGFAGQAWGRGRGWAICRRSLRSIRERTSSAISSRGSLRPRRCSTTSRQSARALLKTSRKRRWMR